MNLSLWSNVGREWASAGSNLSQISTSLGHQGVRATTKIRSQDNLSYQPNIRLKIHKYVGKINKTLINVLVVII